MNAISPKTACECILWFSKWNLLTSLSLYTLVFVYDLTSKHIPNNWVIRCTNMYKLPCNSQYCFVLLTTIAITTHYALLTTMHIMVILHNGWEKLRNEAQSETFDEIASLFSASCPFGKLSVRQNVRSAKRPFGKTPVAKCPFGKMSFGKMSFGQGVFRQNVCVPSSTDKANKYYSILSVQKALVHNQPISSQKWRYPISIATQRSLG
jgi:hypothetical protein